MRQDLNVTDSNFNVRAGAGDQSSLLALAISKLGTVYNGTYYSRVLKIPTGTYYIKPGVTPLLSLTPSNSDITIVGDGAGLTILKILNDVYYEGSDLWAAISYSTATP